MFLKKIVAVKKKEVEQLKKERPLNRFKSNVKKANHSFLRALNSKKPSIIAEIKLKSPSKGMLNKKSDILTIAKQYDAADIQAISVLTDKKYFGGDISYIPQIKKITKKPILRKDFIVDEYQIYEARDYGADAILLIAEILTREKINTFLKIARGLGMDVIVEAHEKMALKKILKTNANIIGINNRDLHSLEMDKRTIQRLSSIIPKNKLLIAESGIESAIDIALLPTNVQSALIGSSIMSSSDIQKKIRELTSQKIKIKICGNTNLEDARAAINDGVDLLGFIVHTKKSLDNLSISEAKKIIKKINAPGKIVAVTQSTVLSELKEICRELIPDLIQLHGPVSISMITHIKKEFPNVRIIKGIPVISEKSISVALTYTSVADLLLLDSARGGSGKTHDWSISKEIIKKSPIPVFLAGGLHPYNVAQAIKTVKPFGVDVNSGVRERPRKKNPEKVKQFINNAQ